MNAIALPAIEFHTPQLIGKPVEKLVRKLRDVQEIFSNRKACASLDPETVVYEVESWFPVTEDTEGGLFTGITHILPGQVGNEYFMTKGHFHQIRNRSEYYFGIQGTGMLLLMDEDRVTRAEKMYPGSIHYIPGHTAHRTANTGNTVLSFGAVWLADAGHDYETIRQQGFSRILINLHGAPALVKNEQVPE